MESSLSIARAIYEIYKSLFNVCIEESKIHKLMYLIQRESFIHNKKILFKDDIFAYRCGPEVDCIKHEYYINGFKNIQEEVSDESRRLIKYIVNRYGNLSAMKLTNLCENEFSWKYSRHNLKPNSYSHVKMNIDIIKLDSMKESFNREYFY